MKSTGDHCKPIAGHDIMALERFAEYTRHMIVFDVISNSSPVGNKGERMRVFLSDAGYKKALESQSRGECKICEHAKVLNGNIFYDNLQEHKR